MYLVLSGLKGPIRAWGADMVTVNSEAKLGQTNYDFALVSISTWLSERQRCTLGSLSGIM